MPKSVLEPTDEQYYELYRRSLIERHIASNGCFLGVIWLVEKSGATADTTAGFLDPVARDSIERYENSSQDYHYKAYPALVSTSKVPEDYLLPGGGDNPLLYGGLAMATFCMEDLKGVSEHSFKYAKKLLDFFLLSEYRDAAGQPTGFLLRRRHHWHGVSQASTDELCGVLLGLHFYIKAATRRNDVQERSRAADLLRRIAAYLKSNSYIYKPPRGSGVPFKPENANVWVYQFPFSRIFKEHLGNSYRSNEVIPEGWQGNVGDLIYIILSGINLDLHYTQRDLFRDVLTKLPAGYTLMSGKDFYNLTMTAYAILMVLLPDIVSDDVKRDIANNGEDFFFDICRYPETDAYNNAFFGVVAKLCRRFRRESSFGKAMPELDGLCRVTMALENNCREYTRSLKGEEGRCSAGYEADVQECTEKEDQGYEACDEWKDEGYYACDDWDAECCDWWPCSWGCKLITYICKGFYWVSNWVCKGWTWVEKWVCVAWEWVKKWVCIGWAWAASGICANMTWTGKKLWCRKGESWAERIEDNIDALLHPRGRWFHDLPIGEPKNATTAPFDAVTPFEHKSVDGSLLLGGHIFTWVHSDDLGHSFTYAMRWGVGKAITEIGPPYDSKKIPPLWKCDESLERLFESKDYQVDPSKGFRLESVGLGLLFPRMLLAYLDMAPLPTLSAENDQEFNVLPVEGPSPVSENMCKVAPTYDLTLGVDGQGDTDPGPGTYTYVRGTQVTVVAVANSGWRFSHWGGDASGTSPTLVITMESNKNVMAYFEEVATIGSNVQITHIFYNGLVPIVESDEYVEITNLGNEPQDLTAWVLKDISEGYPSFTFPPYTLVAGASIRVYTNEIHPEWGGFSFGCGRAIWNNTEPDVAALYDAQGQEISRKTYTVI
jgi:hypothetical protein